MRILKISVMTLLVVGLGTGSVFADGGVKGKISYGGKASKGKKIKMSADPKCLAAYGEKGFKYKAIEVDKNGGLAHAFVYVSKGLGGKKFSPPKESKAILDQKGCWYAPLVSGIQVGQVLQIINSDPMMHNVNAMPNFNAAMPKGVPPMKKKFKKKKVMFRIKCNVHPWMKSYVGILDHPYYATSGADGTYEIKDLPPGKYTLSVWHEKMKKFSEEITVKAKGTTADFKLAKKKRKKRKKKKKKS